MRVLIVDAFAGSGSGRETFRRYERLVRSAFETVGIHEQGRTEYLVRNFRKLEDFCYDNEAAGVSSKATIAAVDKLDFVFVDGDSRILPWHPRTRKLVVFLRTVIGAKKCLFAAGPGAHIVAYVCATGGKTLRVLNGGGDGGSLLELSALRPEDLGGTGKPRRGGETQEVALDSTTGDFYVFNFKTDRWVAEGNVGIQKIKSEIGGVAAAILADASGGFEGNGHTKKVPVNELLGIKRGVQSTGSDISSKALQRPNTPRRVVVALLKKLLRWAFLPFFGKLDIRSEVLVRVRPKSVQHRFLKHVPCGEFLAWSPGKWGIGEMTAARCRRTFAVLAASSRAGPEVLEIDNCLATRFNVRQEYEHATGLLQAFVQHKHYVTRSRSRIDRGSEFVVKGIQAGDDFDGTSISSSLKQSPAAATRNLPEGAASRRRQPQGGQQDPPTKPTFGKRAAPSPRRPPSKEKPRYAPPHSTQTIRAAPPRGADKSPFKISEGCYGEEGSDGYRKTQIAGGVVGGDGLGGTAAALTPRELEATPHSGGLSGPSNFRGTDPAGRRRVLMARMGEGVGVDLSPAIDALLREEGSHGPKYGGASHTARTAPAAPGQQMPGNGTDLPNFGFDAAKDCQNQGHTDKSAVRQEVEQDLGDGSTESEKSRPERRGDKVSAPRRACTVARLGRGGDRNRRDAAEKAVVRVPGDDMRRPYSNFHRFVRMAQETRHVFFSLDSGRAGEAPQNTAAESGRQKKPGIDGRGKTKKPFSANFGTKQAWESAAQPAIRTQGPYLGKNGVALREASLNARHLLTNPKRWTFSGSKTRGWTGIGEGSGLARGAF